MFSSIKNFLKKAWWYFLTSLEVQALLFILLLPIFIWWGIAYSKYAFLGNLIFLPFLWIFLGLSLINVILEFFYIPNTLFILLQDQITHTWIYILKFSHPSWLYCFQKHMFIPSLLISSIVFYRYSFKKHSRFIRLGFLGICMFVLNIGNQLCIPHYGISKFEYKHKKAFIFKYKKTLYLLDYGIFASLQNARSWIEYTLLPHCCLEFGSCNIGCIILYKPSKKARAIAEIIKQYSPHTLFKIYTKV